MPTATKPVISADSVLPYPIHSTFMSSGTSQIKKVALVTGAARGIGRAIALRLASDGCDVAINDLPGNSDNLIKVAEEINSTFGRRVITVFADVSLEEEVKEMVQHTVNALGGLDIMVANAGIAVRRMIVEMTAEEWDHVMAINVRSTFLCYKYAAIQMIAQGKERGGRIIGASSVTGKQGNPLAAAYSTSKFAIRGLTQSAASEYGKYGITVNAYAPGYIETPMTMSEEVTGMKPGELLELTKRRTVVGYNGASEDVASLVSFLASEESHFITGQSVSINGGLFFD